MESEIDIHAEIHGKALEAMEQIYNDYKYKRISKSTASYGLSILSKASMGLSNDRDVLEMMTELPVSSALG
ncbi:hypothetical protein THIOSC15_10008 [uncultured Thiomicrorhabdus sp.]